MDMNSIPNTWDGITGNEDFAENLRKTYLNPNIAKITAEGVFYSASSQFDEFNLIDAAYSRFAELINQAFASGYNHRANY